MVVPCRCSAPALVDGQRQNSEDNRNLSDKDGAAQALGADQIEAMKKAGTTGNEIMGEVIKNSATFKSKTIFSQEKCNDFDIIFAPVFLAARCRQHRCHRSASWDLDLRRSAYRTDRCASGGAVPELGLRYVTAKSKKYSTTVVVARPTTRLLSRYYYERSADKIWSVPPYLCVCVCVCVCVVVGGCGWWLVVVGCWLLVVDGGVGVCVCGGC